MIDTSGWKEFLLDDYFEIVPGKYHYPDEYEDGATPYVSASNENNGIGKFINITPDFEGNCIVTGKVGCTAFYENRPFCATSDVNVFKPKFVMTPAIGMFIATVINFSENYKWAYGRQCRVGNSKKIVISLPATPSGKPDWQYMEEFMGGLHCEPITTSVQSSHLLLETEKWGEFRIGDLFDMARGKTLSSENKDNCSGSVPCINGGTDNNGVLCYLGETVEQYGFHKMPVPSLSLVRVGECGKTFLQTQPYYLADNAFALFAKDKISEWDYLFLSTILDKEIQKYSYGRTITAEKYPNTYISLPQKSDGTPDWQWMEDYMKSLPYGDRISI